MSTRRSQFPDFFSNRGSIATKVSPIKYGNRIYYQSSIITEENDLEPDRRPQLKPYLDNDDEMVDCADIEENYDIVLTKSGKFQTSFYVPSSLLPFIIGQKGLKLKELQRSTNTVIKIPRKNEKGDVVILGETERKVASARTQIALIVAQRKERMPSTHFIAIPIDSETIRDKLLKFQAEVLENPPRGVSKSIFQKPLKTHLTLVMLTLLDPEEVTLAKKTLETFYVEYISKVFENNKKHKVTIQGLEIMNDDPSNVYVLYAKVKMETPELQTKLQDMCDKMSNHFCKSGLAKKEYDRVKLHMTVMNTSFRDSDEEKTSFDSCEIMDKFGDYYFGEFELKELHICIRGTTISDTGESKYYDTAVVIPL